MLKKCICILIPVLMAFGISSGFNGYLDKNINQMLESKDLSDIDCEYGSIYKDRGIVYNNYVSQKGYPVLQGSSELGAQVSQVPTRFFPIKDFPNIVTNGRSYSQDLHQASILGSQGDYGNEKKVALIVSLQWFMEGNGIENNSFQANFSPVQFYNYLSNKNISEENKSKYAQRVSQLLTGSDQYASEKLYARIFSSTSIKGKVADIIFKPYFAMRKYMVMLKDKGLLYKKLKTLPDKSSVSKEYEEVDWNKEEERAEQEAKSQVSNNDFYVFDEYYNKNIRDNLDRYKDSNKSVNLMVSKEFDDYKLYLDTCSDLGIKPYIILMPTNGRWYDYTGMTKQSRDEFYDKVEEIARDRGLDVLNLKDYEYTPYFMCDIMHLGTKGWLKVDEELYKHFKD